MKAFILYVLWHCPEPSSYHPVGRLIRAGENYEFVYLRGVANSAHSGVRVGGFASLEQRYLSHELFPFFANRLMDRRRSDFATYVRSLGFSAAPDDSLALLTRDGRKGTDRFETFGYPEFDQETKQLNLHFWLRGIRWQPDGEQPCLKLQPGQQLHLRSDPDNASDPNALELARTPDESRIGFLPRIYNRDYVALTDLGGRPEIRVAHVNSEQLPVQQRVLCVLRSDWPDTYVPFQSDDMQPVATDAWSLAELMNPRTRELPATNRT